MTNRTNTYYTIRSIVRFVFGMLLTAVVFIGIPAAAGSIWTAIPVSMVLWGFYFALMIRDYRKLAI